MSGTQDYSDNAKRFAAVVQRYCELVESAPTLDRNTFLLSVYKLLPDVIREAVSLPDTDPWKRNDESDEGEEDFRDDSPGARNHEEASQKIYLLLKEKLGELNLYWTVFDPTKEKEAIHGSLADDIAGIYGDLKGPYDGLKQQLTISPAVVIWHWRVHFYCHWGDHAISALRTIHHILSERLNDGESF